MKPPGDSPVLARALSRLDALVDWERRDRGDMRVDLAPVRDLLERLGRPELAFRAVHVGGTKGKGSVAALIDAGLRRAGIPSGCYASPHVSRVTERVRIGGLEVPAEDLGRALERALAARGEALAEGAPAGSATWFDLMTAAAFLLFAAAGVEWAVVEVGLGGRLDSTNVVGAEVCVLTNVDLEHTQVLGRTPGAIAAEKAGILKPGAVLATGIPEGSEAGVVVDERARELGVPVHRPPRELCAGSIEERNRVLAGLALELLGSAGVEDGAGRRLSADLLDTETAAAARLPGRIERIAGPRGLTVVVDGAHVASSVAQVLDELDLDPSLPGSPVVLLALGRDKDAPRVLKTLVGRVDRVLCTSVATGPLRPAEDLARDACALGLAASAVPDPREALNQALAAASAGGWVLTVGSLYLAGAVRDQLLADPDPGPGDPRCSRSSPI